MSQIEEIWNGREALRDDAGSKTTGELYGIQRLCGFDHNQIKEAFAVFWGLYIKNIGGERGLRRGVRGGGEEGEVNIGVYLWMNQVYEWGITKHLLLYGYQFMSTTMHDYIYMLCVGEPKNIISPFSNFRIEGVR